jgi:hypothetical protein
MGDFKKQYRDLEVRVLHELREKIKKSEHISEHVNERSIKVKIGFYYEELTIINDRLTFLDGNGYHYDIFTDVTLEDLIDILESD